VLVRRSAVDAQSTSTVNNAASRTWSHTIASPGTGNLARKLVVCIAVEESADSCATPGNMVVSTVTYAGIALTHIPGADNCAFSRSGGTDFEQRVEMWYLDEDAPSAASGTNNVTVTMVGQSTISRLVRCRYSALRSVHQSRSRSTAR